MGENAQAKTGEDHEEQGCAAEGQHEDLADDVIGLLRADVDGDHTDNCQCACYVDGDSPWGWRVVVDG